MRLVSVVSGLSEKIGDMVTVSLKPDRKTAKDGDVS